MKGLEKELEKNRLGALEKATRQSKRGLPEEGEP